jgi:hypothetical protein
MSIAWMQRDLPGCAELPADYPTTKMDHHREGTHFGLWAGRPLPHHGTSRQHLGGYLVDTAGGEVFCEMPHDELAIGQRCRYRMASDKLGITQVAVDVQAIETPAPVEPIEPDKSGDAVSGSPWKRNRNK